MNEQVSQRIRVGCPQCGAVLQVPGSLAGRQARCPRCRQVFVVGASPPPPPAELPSAEPLPPPVPRRVAGAGRAARAGAGLAFRIVALAGALVMAVAMFVPWWSVSVTRPEKGWGDPDDSDADAAEKRLDDNWETHQAFYRQHAEALAAVIDPLKDTGFLDEMSSPQLTARLCGWSFTAGILSLVFGAVAMPLILVPALIGPIRRWAWTALPLVAGLALPVLIMAISFSASAPHTEVPSILRQGVSAGPWLALAGSVLVLVGGLAALVIELVGFVASRRARSTGT